MTYVTRVLGAVYDGLSAVLAGIAVILLAMITLWIGLEAIARSLGMGTMRGLIEFTEYSIYGIALLAAPWVLKHNGHVRVLIVIESVPAAWRPVMIVIADAISAVVAGILAYYAWQNFMTAYGRQELIYGDLIIPEWWVQWQAPVVLTMLVVGFIRDAVDVAHNGLPTAPIEGI
ncbi:TRAP transporter small permease [Chachezhania sediminis]|uniref:TRAP transporter small permease n=1 Tax=Chachezhania sediminis TaxID=2599291 RepID=UPI00131D1A7B|nr:TRAP transporter small permease [Chachezhania sediminis]